MEKERVVDPTTMTTSEKEVETTYPGRVATTMMMTWEKEEGTTFLVKVATTMMISSVKEAEMMDHVNVTPSSLRTRLHRRPSSARHTMQPSSSLVKGIGLIVEVASPLTFWSSVQRFRKSRAPSLWKTSPPWYLLNSSVTGLRLRMLNVPY
jgi:hypothetical protein